MIQQTRKPPMPNLPEKYADYAHELLSEVEARLSVVRSICITEKAKDSQILTNVENALLLVAKALEVLAQESINE